MLSVVQIPVEGFDDNFSYVVLDAETKECMVVDPCGEIVRVFAVIEKEKLEVVGALITHTHHDHHDKLNVFLERYEVPVYIHENGCARTAAPKELAYCVVHEESIKVGESSLVAYYTPGHHDDCLCFYIESDQSADRVAKLITGDTLFVEGCGRTNESGVRELYESLQFLESFPDETEVLPGHDYGSAPISTIAHEKTHNKYFLAKDFEEFRSIRLPQN